MMHINLCQNQIGLTGGLTVSLQTSVNGGTTWTTVATGQSDVTTIYTANLSITELLAVGSGSWWQVVAVIPNVGGTFAHWNSASASTWIVHRVG